jgi:CHAT domain-containing protein/Flp pilus assembly protein TadD
MRIERWATLCAAMLLTFSFAVLAQRVITVPDDFPTIQAAIDAAEPGDTVHVRAGRYREALVIRKPLHLEGEGRTETEIQPPAAERDVVTVSIDSGTVLIDALTARKGRVGISTNLGKQATLTVLNSIAIENQVGVMSSGSGRLLIRRSFFIDNEQVNAGLGNAVAEVEESEFLLGGAGVLLMRNVAANLSRNLIALGGLGVNLWSQGCGGPEGSATFAGAIAGTGNRVCGVTADLCPDYPNGPWPESFLEPGWTEVVSLAVEAFNRGVGLYNEQEYVKAVGSYEEGLHMLDGAMFPVLEAFIGGNLGMVYDELGRYEEALEAYRAAREVCVTYAMDVRAAIADTNLGVVYDQLGQYEAALAAYKSAREVYVAHAMDVDVARVDGNLGVVYKNLGEYEEARAFYQAAREVFAAQKMVVDVAKVDENLGVVYYELGQYERALETYQAAREVFTAYAMDANVANVDTNLGAVYSDLGWYEEALKAYRAARRVYVAQEMDTAIALVDVNLGVVYDQLGQYEAALAAYKSAREVYVAHAMDVDVARVDGNLGVVYEHLDRYEEALATYAKALSALDRFPPMEGMAFSLPAERWPELLNQGLCFERLERWEEAVSSYRDSIAVIESLRGGLHTEELKLAWGVRTKGVYERLIDLLNRQGQGALGFSYAERCRARTFLDLLAAGPVATLDNVTGAGIGSEGVDPAVIEADLGEMTASLPSDTAVLEYFVTDRAVFLWVVSQAGVQEPLRLEISREDLANQVIAFRQALEAPPSLGNTADEALLAQSRDLYALLVQPIEDKLAGMTHVVIIPSGPLHYLPFAALLRSPGTEGRALWLAQFAPGAYFGDQYALSYAPSLVALKYAQEAAGEVSTERSLLALADPDSGDPALTRLPEARVEAEAVAALFPAHDVYVDRDATEAIVQSQSSTASQLLLSTHGSFNAVNPMYSYLVLAPTDGSDGRLHTYEVFGLDLHADLVVLSACETLLPHLEDMKAQTRAVRGNEEGDVELSPELMEELTSGDEIVGLTRAFLYAGAPSVLASLWSVYSEATKDLMVAFYGYLDQGLDKAEALRQAQRDVRKLYPHPVFWAAFSLVGDWR